MSAFAVSAFCTVVAKLARATMVSAPESFNLMSEFISSIKWINIDDDQSLLAKRQTWQQDIAKYSAA